MPIIAVSRETLAEQICEAIRLSALEPAFTPTGELLRRLKAREASKPPQGSDENAAS